MFVFSYIFSLYILYDTTRGHVSTLRVEALVLVLSPQIKRQDGSK